MYIMITTDILAFRCTDKYKGRTSITLLRINLSCREGGVLHEVKKEKRFVGTTSFGLSACDLVSTTKPFVGIPRSSE